MRHRRHQLAFGRDSRVQVSNWGGHLERGQRGAQRHRSVRRRRGSDHLPLLIPGTDLPLPLPQRVTNTATRRSMVLRPRPRRRRRVLQLDRPLWIIERVALRARLAHVGKVRTLLILDESCARVVRIHSRTHLDTGRARTLAGGTERLEGDFVRAARG